MLSTVGFREFESPAPGADRLARRETDELLLLRETHHRVANTLAVLTSLLRRDLRTLASAELRDSLARYESRIVALGNLHRCLIVGGTSDWISARNPVEPLCKALFEAILEPLGVRFEVTVDRGELPSERCELICLIIAELIMNAVKHAFHGRDAGLVRMELIRKGGSWLCVVSDNGRGMELTSRGVGSKIIDRLVQELRGKLARRSGKGGTSVSVTFPISQT